jgi:hypothetical protein
MNAGLYRLRYRPAWWTGRDSNPQPPAVAPAGSDPASAAFQAAANPSQLESHEVGKQGLEPRPPGPKPGALTLTPHPAAWRRWESNPLRQRLQGAPAPIAVIPGCGPGRYEGAAEAHDYLVRALTGRTDVSHC